MWLTDFKIASKWFFRGLKRKDWLWLILAVIISSASVTTVELLTKTIKDSLLEQSADSLGADLVLKSSQPIDLFWQEQARYLGLQTSESRTLATMASNGNDFQLVRLTAIADNYPLKGKQHQLNQSILIESALVPLLKLADNSEVLLGKTKFAVAGQFQPKNIAMSSVFAHQILMPLSMLEQTGLVGVGSRVTHRLSVAGSEAKIIEFADLVNKQEDQTLELTLATAPTEDLARSLNTAWLFLELSALATVLVAGLSILIASRFYLQKWQSSIALMRSLGASNKQVFRLFAWQLSLLAFIASLIGVALGSLLFFLLSPMLANYFQPLVVPSFGIIHLKGILIGFLVLWAFSWQAFASAINTSALALLKTTKNTKKTFFAWFVGLFLIVIIVSLVTNHVLWVVLGLAIISIVLYYSAVIMLLLISYWQKKSSGWLKISLSSLTREASLVKLQLVSIGLVLFVLMLMTFVKQDMLQNWQASLPANTPNAFIMNIQVEQKQQVLDILNKHQINAELISVARGRLIALNDKPLTIEEQESKRAQRLLGREANIAVMDFPLFYNEIIAQSVTNFDDDMAKVSVEETIAELFGLKINDTLTFSFSGQNISYRIDSIRQVKWQSLNLNFFFIIDQQHQIPISYLGSFLLTGNDMVTSNQLIKEFSEKTPGVLFIDAKKMIQQIQSIMEQASWAVSGLYVFILIASLIVLFTATLASQQGRLQSWALLRVMGANKKQVLKIGVMEFVLLGATAGVIAAIFAQATSVLISNFALKLSPQLNIELWIFSLFSGVAILLVIGLFTQYQYLQLSVHKMAKKA